jgi:hypothetical protein
MPTNIPDPTFGDNGFVAPSDQAILDGAQADIDQAFGGGVNPALNTPQGQLASSWAAAVSNKNALLLKLFNQVDPAFSSGRMQDAIGRIYFLTRNPSQATVVPAILGGAAGLLIPAGSLAQATDGNVYALQNDVVIGQNGTVSGTFLCGVLGPVACPAGSLNKIFRAIPGWDTVINPNDGVLGTNVESPQQFEARRKLSVALNATNINEAVLAKVLGVPGVLDAFVVDNPQGVVQQIGGFLLNPHSIYIAAVGGADADVAAAIWTKKPPGCDMNGNTTVVVSGDPAVYSPPLPTWNITFERPPALPILFAVTILNSSQVPANAVSLIQNAIINAFGGGDGGPRARIGSTIFAFRFASAIIALGSWAQIVSLQIGSPNTPSATFQGTIAGNTLTVSNVQAGGAIAIGQTVTDLNGAVLPGTVITAGGGANWTVNNAQNVANIAMSSAVANRTNVAVNINQVPTVNPANISVALQ